MATLTLLSAVGGPADLAEASPVHCVPSQVNRNICSAPGDAEIKSASPGNDVPAPASGPMGKVAPIVHPIKMWN
nr:hypothetical protein [Mycobacteroides abscessus]